MFSVNWEQVRKKFFVALNSVLSNCSGASDLMKLYLYESYCLPLLNYVIESLDPSKKTLRKLNVYWYTAFRKIFLDEPWEPVNGLIGALGRINLEFTYYQRKACFLNNMLNCDNCFVYHIMALYLHSNEYELLCKSAGVSAYRPMLVNIVSGVISVKSFTMHMFCSLYCFFSCLMFACILLLVLHRRW